MSNQGTYITAAAATVGVLGGAYVAYKVYKEHQKPILPEKWTQVGTLKTLRIYPIKSCAPVVLETAECSILGLRDGWLRDRVLMVVDSNYNFVTARTLPHLLLIQPTVKNTVLTLEYPDKEPIHVNLAEVVATQKPRTAQVWSMSVPVYDCGHEVSEWFSRIIDNSTSNYRLVYYASEKSRSLGRNANSIFKFSKNDSGALPDEVSYNLINEASVEDLNSRMEDCKVTELNFRPSFLLTGAKAYDEDNWKFVKIGENIFEVIKPCVRCVLTTIDPETGVRNPNREPLKTLNTYRQIQDPVIHKAAGSGPQMGLQMALRSAPGGVVSVDDPIYVA